MEEKIQQNKPSKLDYALAFSPIPFIGEKKAKKVAEYLVKCEYEREGKTDISEIQKECDIDNKICISRIIGYVFVPTITYAIYKLPEFLNNVKELTSLILKQ